MSGQVVELWRHPRGMQFGMVTLEERGVLVYTCVSGDEQGIDFRRAVGHAFAALVAHWRAERRAASEADQDAERLRAALWDITKSGEQATAQSLRRRANAALNGGTPGSVAALEQGAARIDVLLQTVEEVVRGEHTRLGVLDQGQNRKHGQARERLGRVLRDVCAYRKGSGQR